MHSPHNPIKTDPNQAIDIFSDEETEEYVDRHHPGSAVRPFILVACKTTNLWWLQSDVDGDDEQDSDTSFSSTTTVDSPGVIPQRHRRKGTPWTSYQDRYFVRHLHKCHTLKTIAVLMKTTPRSLVQHKIKEVFLKILNRRNREVVEPPNPPPLPGAKDNEHHLDVVEWVFKAHEIPLWLTEMANLLDRETDSVKSKLGSLKLTTTASPYRNPTNEIYVLPLDGNRFLDGAKRLPLAE